MSLAIDPRYDFNHISLAQEPFDNWSGAVLLLDTHVVSALDGIAQNGYRPNHPSHIRAANLLRRIWNDRAEGIIHSLDTLEGAGFHRGGVESYSAVHRFSAVSSLLKIGPDRLEEFLASGEAAEGPVSLAVGTKVSQHLDEVVRVLPWIFTPSYAMTLALHVAEKNKKAHLDYACQVFDSVPVMPDVAVLSSILAFLGKGNLRSHIRDGLYLLRRTGDATAIQSASWDLAHLEYLDWLSLVRFETDKAVAQVGASKLFLVTEDGNLARLGRALVTPHKTGVMKIRDGELRQSDLPDANRIRARLQLRDSSSIDWSDEWRVYEQLSESLTPIVRQLEAELGIEPLKMQVWPMEGEEIERNWKLISDLLSAILTDQSGIVNFLERETHRQAEVLLPVLHFAVLMAHDNANARKRSVDESLESLLLFDRQSASDAMTGQVLVLAACQEDAMMLNAVIRSIQMDVESNFGPVLFVVVMVLKRFLEDTASAHGVGLESVVRVLQLKMELNADKDGSE